MSGLFSDLFFQSYVYLGAQDVAEHAIESMGEYG
jgi:hypothetical protein